MNYPTDEIEPEEIEKIILKHYNLNSLEYEVEFSVWSDPACPCLSGAYITKKEK